MRSAANIAGHPLHPMLIPYPFALLSAAAAFDGFAASRGNGDLARTARHMRVAGLVSALVAAVPGIVDYFARVPEGRPRANATGHALSNVSALALFTAADRLHDEDGIMTGQGLALQAAGTLLLSIGGWLGGNLVYHHQIGVDPEEPASSPMPRLTE